MAPQMSAARMITHARCHRAPRRRNAVVLDAVKGHGIAEAENTEMNHSMPINDERYGRWMAELQADLTALEG